MAEAVGNRYKVAPAPIPSNLFFKSEVNGVSLTTFTLKTPLLIPNPVPTLTPPNTVAEAVATPVISTVPPGTTDNNPVAASIVSPVPTRTPPTLDELAVGNTNFVAPASMLSNLVLSTVVNGASLATATSKTPLDISKLFPTLTPPKVLEVAAGNT